MTTSAGGDQTSPVWCATAWKTACAASGWRRGWPPEDDYFVLKPKHSGFFSTTLDTLLAYLGAETLIVTGLTADSCVMFTAADAHMRDFNVVVPPDCVAALDEETKTRALALLAHTVGADLTPSAALDLGRLALGSGRPSQSRR